jgi:hypothetical protein
MLKKLGPDRFGGDNNVCELTRVCLACEGTSVVPPRVGSMVTQDASKPCSACKTGLVVQRFKTIDDLKAFVAAL